jgi:hypothetical protein
VLEKKSMPEMPMAKATGMPMTRNTAKTIDTSNMAGLAQ